jgi:signal peptide peptidase SppA
MNGLWAELVNRCWCILPDYLQGMQRAARNTAGSILNGDQLAAMKEEPLAVVRAGAAKGKAVAIIPIRGMIRQRGGGLFGFLFGGASTEGIGAAFRQALADDTVGAIVLDVDSPGGTTFGVPELAAEILAGRERKPVVAVASGYMASAAYWIASAAGEIVAAPSAMVGSIGVYYMHVDWSKELEAAGIKVTLIHAGKYKVEDSPHAPLADDARARLQAQVDEMYTMFVDAVAAGRKTTPKAVREGYGEGAVLTAKEAKAAGLVDRIATLQQTIERLGASATTVPNAALTAPAWRALLDVRG